jgi:hypothetical protein
MELYQINTTSFSEEDMLLISNASYDEIEKTLEPWVQKEKTGDVFYDHYDYLDILMKALPQYKFIYIAEPHLISL